jgi:hypothetical protein
VVTQNNDRPLCPSVPRTPAGRSRGRAPRADSAAPPPRRGRRRPLTAPRPTPAHARLTPPRARASPGPPPARPLPSSPPLAAALATVSPGRGRRASPSRPRRCSVRP